MNALHEQLEGDIRGPRSSAYLPLGSSGRLFGGSVVAQMLMSAYFFAHDGARCHSLHATFLRSGDPSIPVVFDCQRLRTSRRFTTVRVDAHQGEMVATASVSFHSREESAEHDRGGLFRARDPELAGPALGLLLPALDSQIRLPFDFRDDGTRRGPRGGTRASYWVRCSPPLDGVGRWQEAALAWASDFSLTRAAGLDHLGDQGRRQAASLDHSMWFHRPPDLNDWLHYEVESPIYRESLALSTGRFRDAAGRLVSTVCQESLLRYRSDEPSGISTA